MTWPYAAQAANPPEGPTPWIDDRLRATHPLAVVIGLGNERTLDAIGRRAPNARVLAFEPDAGTAAALRASAAGRSWIDSGRLVLLADPAYEGTDNAWRVFPANPDDHALLVHPLVEQDIHPGAVRAIKAYREVLFGARANAEARRRFAPRYLLNTLRNAAAIVNGRDVRDLEGAFRGVPAVLVAAGPSLDCRLADVAAARDRAIVIAADTALRPLVDAGIAPRFVVGVDPGAANARHFNALPRADETWLIAESALDPAAAARFAGRTFWFRVASHHPWPWLNANGVDVGRLDVWGSVLTAAFQFAVLAGCDPIAIVGADLAFSDRRPYARGTTYEFDWGRAAALGNSVRDIWNGQLAAADLLRVRDLAGRDTITTGPLKSFRDWVVANAARSGRRVVNAGGAGILAGDGIEAGTLADVLEQASPLPAPTVRSGATAAAPAAAIARRLRESHPTDEWREFAGAAYDETAVDDAIAAAVLDLEGGGRRQTARPEIAVPPGTGILTRIPEGLARLHGVFNSIEQPASEPVNRDRLLVTAFDLLARLVEEIPRHADELASPFDGDLFGRVPMSAVCAWPEPTTWAVELFEALLGTAWGNVSIPSVAPFYAAPVRPRDAAGEPAAIPPGHPSAAHAAVALVLEWLLCVLSDRPTARQIQTAAWLRAFEAAIRPQADSALPTLTAVFSLAITGEGRGREVNVPLGIDEAALARVLTGHLRCEHAGGGEVQIVRLDRPQFGVAASLRFDRLSGALLMVPRVLTDEGLPRATFAYSLGHAAVVVPTHGWESVAVGETGSRCIHRRWPRPIVGELPLGVDGAVAWSNGTAAWPRLDAGYVMARPGTDADVVTHEMPFRPTNGAWWRGRLWWSCYPAGVGSWAPGADPTSDLPDLTLFGIEPLESELVLHPCTRAANGPIQRKRLSEGWRWTPGAPPAPTPLDRHGAVSTRSVAGGWSATAFPEADLIRFQNGARAVEMTCYYPFAVAWAGRSLVVCTTGGDVLLFERIADRLDQWR